jgi:DnaJ-class molecular chaperone
MKTMTEMENTVMNMTRCDRQTANLVANAILDIDRKTEKDDSCLYCKGNGYIIIHGKIDTPESCPYCDGTGNK